MDSKNAIEVRNISKTFKLEIEDTEKKKTIFNKNPTKVVENKVIDNISLDIRKGEVVGIIGRNGSGKSTFLSLLAKIMEPDSGTIERSGKIASILELGMGFHPDMSGRDNIYLKGELYGFSKKEIDDKIDEIIKYSGIGNYIDNPVRTYSSGMNGRLAFAIMVNVDSDIMLVDEVLSVGDAAFSSKAQMHFKKLASSGKTVIIVSHSTNALEEMCSRVIWIDGGKIEKDGPSKSILAEYRNKINESPEIISDLARNGLSDAQYKLAIMYRDGHSFGQDIELYHKWLEDAAIQGHTRAQVEYADYLINCNKPDDALSYYRSAADKGDTEAKTKLSALNSCKNEEIQQLLETFKQLAETDDPVQEYRYADLLLKTSWGDEDKQKSFQMFNKSALHDYPNAIHQLGLMYKEGVGTPRDLSKMEIAFTKAAALGYMPSITLLADIYAQGRLLPKNEVKSFEMVKKASLLGNVGFMYRLATMYRDGIGTDKDQAESKKWFDNYTSASLYQYKIWAIPYLRSNFVGNHEVYKTILNSTTINCNVGFLSELANIELMDNPNNQNVFERLIELARMGNIEAIRKIGDRYYNGVGVQKNYSKALKWYVKSAKLGDSWSKNKIGEMYRDGKGSPINIDMATQWFLSSSQNGNFQSIVNLLGILSSSMYEDKVLFDIVINTIKSMASSGNIDFIKRLGNMYYEGNGFKRDYTMALTLYKKAALLGDAWSKTRVAEMYRDGKGTDPDYECSGKWFSS